MARPRKIQAEENEVIEMSNTIHIRIMPISKTFSHEGGARPREEVEALLEQEEVSQGYKLFHAQFLNELPEAYQIGFVFVKEA